MHGVRAAPVVFLSIAAAGGIVAADLIGFTPAIGIFAAAGLIVATATILARLLPAGRLSRLRDPLLTLLVLLLVAATGAAMWKISAEQVYRNYPLVDKMSAQLSGAAVEGLIIDEPKVLENAGNRGSRQAYRFLISVRSSGSLKGVRLAVTLNQDKGSAPPRWGELWRLKGFIGRADFPDNPGFERHLFHRKVVAVLDVKEGGGNKLLDSYGSGVSLARTVRDFGAGQARRYLPDQELALLMGVSLGDGSYLSEELSDKFRITGLSHMVVASGMNIAVVVACIVFPLAALAAPRYLRVTLGSMGAILYVIIAGAQPSVTRAGVMAVIALVISLFFKKADLISLIATSALLLLAVDPFSLFNLSFQLSYAATIGLAFLMPLAGKLVFPLVSLLPDRRPRAWLQEALQVTVAAQLAVSPIILHNFGTLSPYTLPANIAAVPVAGFVLIAGLAAPVAGLVWYPLGVLLYAPLHAALAYLIGVADFFAALPAAGAAIQPLSAGWAASLAGVILLLGGAVTKEVNVIQIALRRLWTVSFALAFIFALLIWNAAAGARSVDQFQVTFLDIGQGDSTLAEAPGGTTLLFDTGAKGHSLIRKLREENVRKIDLLVISHFHADHAGEAAEVIRRFPVGAVLASPRISNPAPLRKEVELAMKERKVRFITAAEGREITFGLNADRQTVKVEILTPSDGPMSSPQTKLSAEPENPNDNSVVTKLLYGKTSFLLTGDLEKNIQKELTTAGADLAASVLKVPHHGSRDSADESFMREVRPSVSVITVGCRNSYHHPHAESLQLLDRLGGRIYRTDHDGAIKVVSNGSRIEVHPKGSARPCR